MTDNEHRELAHVLHRIKGKAAVSGYHCDLMGELYSDWYFTDGPTKLVHSVKQYRTEVLWTNYPIHAEIPWQATLNTSSNQLINEP